VTLVSGPWEGPSANLVRIRYLNNSRRSWGRWLAVSWFLGWCLACQTLGRRRNDCRLFSRARDPLSHICTFVLRPVRQGRVWMSCSSVWRKGKRIGRSRWYPAVDWIVALATRARAWLCGGPLTARPSHIEVQGLCWPRPPSSCSLSRVALTKSAFEVEPRGRSNRRAIHSIRLRKSAQERSIVSNTCRHAFGGYYRETVACGVGLKKERESDGLRTICASTPATSQPFSRSSLSSPPVARKARERRPKLPMVENCLRPNGLPTLTDGSGRGTRSCCRSGSLVADAR